MTGESDHDDFARGIELFNAGRYFESHESLEQVWAHAEGVEKTILQGLIQAAAALLHLERGNWIGARSLMLKSMKNLEKVPKRFRKITLAGFARKLEKSVLAVEAGNPSAARPMFRWVD